MLNSTAVVPTAISYASSNPAVVAVDPSTGFYECKAEGIAAITATVQYKDPSYSTKTYQTVKTLNITVKGCRTAAERDSEAADCIRRTGCKGRCNCCL